MRGFLQSFLRSENGVVAPTVAITFAALVAAAGAATDYARAQMVQTKLADTLDAAGLAAGSSINSADPEDVAQNYFNVNFPSPYMNSTAQLDSVVENDSKTQLDLSASATVPTVFMQMMGFDSITVTASTQITRRSTGLELVLVMDTTGSMAGSKLTSMKNAAKNLVNILFGDDATKDDLWIGLVPFSQAVNIGNTQNTRDNWLNTSHYNGLNWGPTSWSGCVEARVATGRDVTDDPPSVERFRAYYWGDHGNPDGNGNYNNWRRNSGSYYSGIGPDLGPNKYCPQPLQTLTNTKSTIIAGIDAMQARGNTHVNIGAVWGWRMLSPRWRGLWGGAMDANSLPLDYSTPYMNKAIVLLTDGENTMSNSVDGAYGYLTEGQLGTTSSSTATTRLNTRLTTVCNSMKSHNIKVYTILFEENGTTIRNLMQNCASQTDFFFMSDSANLNSAFHAIGDSLSNLRISR
jgi:Flp pilus assembly protein TadG